MGQQQVLGETQYLTGPLLTSLVLGLTMAAFLLMIDSTILVTTIPSLTTYFKSLQDVGWYGTGSLICALAKSSLMFIIGRVVSGCGGAGILNGAFVIIAAAAPLESRPKLMGIILGVASLGVAVGPLIGGALTQRVSWRWCFYINLPAGAITVITLGLARIPNAKLQKHQSASRLQQINSLDLPGCVLFAAAILMVLLALDWGGVSHPWDSPIIINLFWGSGVTLCLFLLWEYRKGEEAMLPLDLIRQRVIAFSAAASFMSYGGLYVIIVYLPLWFQALKEVSPLMSGVYYLPSVITTTLVSKIGFYTPFMLLGGALASVAAGLMSTLTPGSPVAAWVCYQLVNGIARGMLAQQPINAIQANLPKEQLSTGTALIVFCQNFGAAVFISISQTIFQNSLTTKLEDIVPAVDVSAVVEAGAIGFRDVVPSSQEEIVAAVYNKALITTFYLPAGLSVAVFGLAWGMGWVNIKKRKDA
ncbi:MFS general substrate transporter [Trichoderma velutinum]